MKIKFLLLIVLIGALAFPVLGTTIPKLELRTLVAKSDRILQGRVEVVEVEIVFEEGQRRPYTKVRVRVDDPLYSRRGDRRQAVFLRYLGGRMETPNGPVDVAISGMPQFKNGDNVILFLKESSDGVNHTVVGLNQGKYLIVNEVAISNVTGVELVDPKSRQTIPGGHTQSAPVDAFKARIRELVK